ncbi:cytidylate kinase Cmk [Methanobrevibacter ruminantium M1]|uniref:Cytidylate kinase n=1 Tax=Methanobrevibacter ruminantium (strain ATCC 35063 / DSM 1093 / JCM 13430 / OCM 146 / M1) TaxID=634498 RepID=D3E2G9_METRM|nr:AAA family ATPase [Methanobrevibacter ruminantium]ADC46730.1 cytidylate kinase Cmk [Methanobrevibacter ruminantium M1]
MIITIGGVAGSGTTTAAKVLSEKLGVPYISAGAIFREMAEEHGMTPVEFGKFAENNTDIDKEIDNRQAKLAEEADDLIIEGRLSAYFIDADLKVCFTAPLDVRAKRVCERENKSVETARLEIIAREESEAIRYRDIHNIDIKNMDIYDLIINTNSFDPESISEIIITTLKVI